MAWSPAALRLQTQPAAFTADSPPSASGCLARETRGCQVDVTVNRDLSTSVSLLINSVFVQMLLVEKVSSWKSNFHPRSR